ncbi:MAG: hypothetical protein WBI40_09495 [Methylococcaceae bacterium]
MSWYDNVFLAEPDEFDDYENPAVLEKCIVKAEEFLCELLPDDVSFQTIKDSFKKFYDAFIDAYTDEIYIDEHAAWLDHELSY